MQKLILKIEEAKIKTGLSERKLSAKLGHVETYLSSIRQKGATTKTQKILIGELEQVINGDFKTDAEVISELTQRLVEAQEINVLNIQIKQNMAKHISDLLNTNNELNQELNTMRKNAQESDRAIEQAKKVNDTIDSENDQLREAIEFAKGQFTDKCNETYLLNKKLKSEKLWTIAFIVLSLVLSYLLWVK